MGQVAFADWKFHVGGVDDRGELYLQIKFDAPCSKTGEGNSWSGRKWRLSRHMVKSEIVQTAFLAVLTAMEHETRENFLYRGRAIFAPHFDVDAMWGMATPANEETRHPPQGVYGRTKSGVPYIILGEDQDPT